MSHYMFLLVVECCCLMIFMLLQADVSGTIVKWLVENGSQITPGQVQFEKLSAACVHAIWMPGIHLFAIA